MAIAVKAQNKGTVKAIILDSLNKEPIQFATVSILRLQDSSLISYTITDKNGAFALYNVHEEASRLLISHVGYQSLHINLQFKNNEIIDLGKQYLVAKMLNEVVVKGERVPIIIKKDTIEFDAEAFKTRPNALVEDLLKKLPGIQVDGDGRITVNGKDVSKIRVNGKDFFTNDPTMATRNLEADMISKVQVYDDRDDDPDHLAPDNEVKKIINLKFKKSFTKGILSTLGAGAGTQNRYAASGFAAKFQDDLQISGKIGIDNLSSTGNFLGSSGGFSTFSFGALNTGLRKTNTGNFDLTKDISKKLKLHIEYRFSNDIGNNNSNSKLQQNIGDTTITTLSEDIQHQRSNNQDLHAEIEWKPDSNTIIKFNPDLGYNYNTSENSSNSSKSNTFSPLLNTIASSDAGKNNAFQYQHNLNYYHKLNKKGASLTIANTIGVQTQSNLDLSANDLISYVATFPSDTLRRSAKNTNNDVSQGLNAAYHYPITKKLSADVTLIGIHDRNSGELLTYDEDFKTGLYTIFLQNQSSNLIRSLWGESLAPQLTYIFAGDISLKAGLIVMAQQIGNHFNSYTNDLDQKFSYLFPSAELRVKNLTLSYSESVQQPSINNLQPITIVYTPLNTFIGNPTLKPTYYHNINLYYRKYDFQSGINFNINTRMVIETNTVINEQTINAEGATVSMPINRNGRFSTYLNGYFAKNFKKRNKWQLYVGTNVDVNAAHNFFIVNRQNGYQNTQNISIKENINLSWNDVVNFEPSYGIDHTTTQYHLVNYPNTQYTTQVAGMVADVSLPENFRWKVEYNYKYNPLVAPGFQRNTNMLNFSVSKRIQDKGRGEVGLVCYDVLNQNVSSSHFVYANSVTDVQNQVLKRYVLLTYTYHFKQFK
jgi:hypothetical protein